MERPRSRSIRRRRYRRGRASGAMAAILGATAAAAGQLPIPSHRWRLGQRSADQIGPPPGYRPPTASLRTDVKASLDHQPSRQRRRWEERMRRKQEIQAIRARIRASMGR